MFPPRKNPDILLPPPDPNATKYAHTNAQEVKESMMELQGSGGISHMDAKVYRKVLSSKACIPESKSMCEAIAKICNKLAAKEIAPEITTPMRAVRIIAMSKSDGGIRPIGVGEVVRRVTTKTMAKVIKESSFLKDRHRLDSMCRITRGLRSRHKSHRRSIPKR